MKRPHSVPKYVHEAAPLLAAAIEGAFGNGADWTNILAEVKAIVRASRSSTSGREAGIEAAAKELSAAVFAVHRCEHKSQRGAMWRRVHEARSALHRALSPVESPGEERPRADLAEIERMVSEYGRAIVYGGNGLKALEARATLLSAIRSLRAPREVEEVRRERDRLAALVAKHEERYAGSAICGEVLSFLEAAGCGKPGSPNTLWSMVQEIIADRDRLARLSSPSGEAPEPCGHEEHDPSCGQCMGRLQAQVRALASGEAPERGDGEGRS